MILTPNQELVLAQIKYTIAKIDKKDLEKAYLHLAEDYFKYQNQVKDLAKKEAFSFLGSLAK